MGRNCSFQIGLRHLKIEAKKEAAKYGNKNALLSKEGLKMPAWWSKRSRMGQAVDPSLSSLPKSSMERLAVIIVERLSPQHMIVSRRTSPLGPNLPLLLKESRRKSPD
jgi:hypothetical protein